jgi:phage-related protein
LLTLAPKARRPVISCSPDHRVAVRSGISGHELSIFDKDAYMWTVEYLLPAADERANLPPDIRARLQRMVDTIQVHGLLALPRDWAKPLGDKLWELRITGKNGIARAIYVTATDQRVVVVRIFVKKTQKTPKRELELARQRAKEVE